MTILELTSLNPEFFDKLDLEKLGIDMSEFEGKDKPEFKLEDSVGKYTITTCKRRGFRDYHVGIWDKEKQETGVQSPNYIFALTTIQDFEQAAKLHYAALRELKEREY